MTRIFGFIAAACVLFTSLPAYAQMASPEGKWEIEMRDSRYDVVLCGESGNQLCGTLVWLGNGADNAENLPYLNTLLIDHAPLVGNHKWRGKMNLYGHEARGTITQVNDNQISLQGCFFGIICRTYQMYRFEENAAQ